MIAGIDPGVHGAIAILSADLERFEDVLDMPTITGRDGKLQVDAFSLHKCLVYYPVVRIYVEHVNAMPAIGRGERRTMGATSAFNFGRSFGSVEAAISIARKPVIYVRPATWKARAGLRGTPKDYARTAARNLYPHAAEHLNRVKDGGRADAILIARYGGIIGE